MTTVTSASDIREKGGIVIRDLLKADSTLLALIGRTANDSIFYGTPSTKTRFELKYPCLIVDLMPSDFDDYSNDGTIQTGIVRIKITAYSPDQFKALKMADRAFAVIGNADATLLSQGFTLRSTYTSSIDGVAPDGKMLWNEGVTLNLIYIGSRS